MSVQSTKLTTWAKSLQQVDGPILHKPSKPSDIPIPTLPTSIQHFQGESRSSPTVTGALLQQGDPQLLRWPGKHEETLPGSSSNCHQPTESPTCLTSYTKSGFSVPVISEVSPVKPVFTGSRMEIYRNNQVQGLQELQELQES